MHHEFGQKRCVYPIKKSPKIGITLTLSMWKGCIWQRIRMCSAEIEKYIDQAINVKYNFSIFTGYLKILL